MQDYHVAFCCSGQRGLKYLAVAGLSLWATHCCPEKVHVHLLWENIAPEQLAQLEESWSPYHGQFFFYRVSDAVGEQAFGPKYGYWFRTWLATVLPSHISRVLYLDYDVIVMQDVSELWQLELDTYAAAVVWDPFYRRGGLSEILSQEARARGLEFAPDEPYFNSGVLYINLDWWRDNDVGRVLNETYAAHRAWFYLYDQDELNLFFRGKVLPLSPKWNLLEPLSLYREWDFDVYEGLGHPSDYFQAAIRHFSGGCKPDAPLGRASEKALFYRYLDQTEWAGWRSENDRSVWGRLVSQMVEFHYFVQRGYRQGCLDGYRNQLTSLTLANPILPFLYAAVPLYRAALKLKLRALAWQNVAQDFWRRCPQDLASWWTAAHKRLLPRALQRASCRLYRWLVPDPPGAIAIPPFLRAPVHDYAGHSGPWIENDFHAHFQAAVALGRSYIPMHWTDYYVRYGHQAHFEIQDYLNLALRSDGRYFTVVQHDLGIAHSLPEDTMVFAAGGVGEVPIPLLMGTRQYSFQAKKRFKVTFQGNVSTTERRTVNVRHRMFDCLSGKEGFHFLPYSSPEAFRQVVAESEFVLCPRGFGATSFRLYEVMSLGAIPIYVWEDCHWLPYRELLDWEDLIISVHHDELETLPLIVHSMSSEEIRRRQDSIRRLWDSYFTLHGTRRYVLDYLTRENSPCRLGP